MSALHEEFDELDRQLTALIEFLESADERFWSMMLKRGLDKVRSRHLAGATYVLGCYGGMDTFSDFSLDESELAPNADYSLLNRRLTELRTATFEAAQVIASRRSW